MKSMSCACCGKNTYTSGSVRCGAYSTSSVIKSHHRVVYMHMWYVIMCYNNNITKPYYTAAVTLGSQVGYCCITLCQYSTLHLICPHQNTNFFVSINCSDEFSIVDCTVHKLGFVTSSL